MKINVEIDCTPEEARAFFGLPDLSPVHEAMVTKMTQLASEGLSAQDMESMMRTWMAGMAGMGENFQTLQKAFWSSVPKKPAD
ncbi:MAG: DUF6489 family protein [Pseudomonadota bacterium]